MKVKEKEPEWGIHGPIWWHHHGTKARVDKEESSIKNGVLRIRGSAFEVKIIRAPGGYGWFVRWSLNHGGFGEVNGQVWMPDGELAAAFGLKDEVKYCSEWLINRFGGTVAKQRQFIRYKEFLNIPCPGTAHDGDPNVSIKLNEEIKAAVHDLLFSEIIQ